MTNIIKTLAFGAALTVAACGASPAYAEFFDIPKPDTSQRERVAEILKKAFPELPVNSEPSMMEHPFQQPVCSWGATRIFEKLDQQGYILQSQGIADGVPMGMMVTRRGAFVVYSTRGDAFCVLMEGVIDTLGN